MSAQVFQRFEWVISDKLARSSAPHYKNKDADQKMDNVAIQFLVDKGIKNVISLNEVPLTDDEKKKLQQKDIKYRHLPVKDYTAPTIDDLCEAYTSYRSAQTTLVYCGYGYGRTGTVIAAFSLFGHRYTGDQYKKLFHVEKEEQCDVLDKLAKVLR